LPDRRRDQQTSDRGDLRGVARSQHPRSIAVGVSGDLVIGDEYDYRARIVEAKSCSASYPFGLESTVAGDIYTVAGTGRAGLQWVMKGFCEGSTATARRLLISGVPADPKSPEINRARPLRACKGSRRAARLMNWRSPP
jgi:hypothetical protein